MTIALGMACAVCANAGVTPNNPIDSVKLQKIETILKAVDDLDDLQLYCDVTELLYDANADNPIGELLAVELIKFGTPEQVRKVKDTLNPATLHDEKVARYIRLAEVRESTQPGMPYKDIEGESRDGKKLQLSQLMKPGKYTLVDFWASWCPYCIREIPEMKQLATDYADVLEVVGVAVRDEKDKTAAMVDKKGISWPVVYNTGQTPYDLYGFVGIPHHMLIGPDGKIVSRGETLGQIAARMAEAQRQNIR